MMPNFTTRSRTFIRRWGKEVAIRRRSGGETTDRLRNKNEGSYAMIGTEICAQYYGEGENTKSLMDSGMRHEANPRLMFFADANIEEGDRVYWSPTETYQIDRVTSRQHYTVADTKLVD